MENKIIDIHSHIAYGIDDGAKNLEEAIAIINSLKEQGVKEIILTPHYMEETEYITPVIKVKEIVEELQKYTDLKLYIGNEVYISSRLLELIEKKQISTINNSKYLLIELPMSNELRDLEDILYDLTISGITPIIAHPERYSYVQENIKFLDKYIEMGVLFQGNYGSLIGKYGKTCQKTLKKLLKNNYISFMGTDIHRISHPIDLNSSLKKLKKIVKNQNQFNNITYINMKHVIQNEDINKN